MTTKEWGSVSIQCLTLILFWFSCPFRSISLLFPRRGRSYFGSSPPSYPLLTNGLCLCSTSTHLLVTLSLLPSLLLFPSILIRRISHLFRTLGLNLITCARCRSRDRQPLRSVSRGLEETRRQHEIVLMSLRSSCVICFRNTWNLFS